MKESRPSFTAAWVAACRGVGGMLPPESRLVDDPFGLRFAGPVTAGVMQTVARVPALISRMPAVLWLQIRTRVLDDVLRDFVAAGGRQVLILGAGFDCRAARFAGELHASTVFEVDHPATQARKKRILDEAGARQARTEYLAWDFEREPMSLLPERLAAHGHRREQPTLTIWEGVSVYLSTAAVEATVAAVRALSAPGSTLAITYFDRAHVLAPPIRSRLLRRFLASVGEPFRFGWEPTELSRWLDERGFALVSDRTDLQLAARLMPEAGHHLRDGGFRHIAVATRSG